MPISLSYDRVLEGETFPFELLDEKKIKETFSRMIRSSTIYNGMKFGRRPRGSRSCCFGITKYKC